MVHDAAIKQPATTILRAEQGNAGNERTASFPGDEPQAPTNDVRSGAADEGVGTLRRWVTAECGVLARWRCSSAATIKGVRKRSLCSARPNATTGAVRFERPVESESFKLECKLSLPEHTLPATLSVTCDVSTQHKISWSTDVHHAGWQRVRDVLTESVGSVQSRLRTFSTRARPSAKVQSQRWRRSADSRAKVAAEAKRWRLEAARAATLDVFSHRQLPPSEEESLLAGTVNLYSYPTLFSAEYPRGSLPSDVGMRILRGIVIELATNHRSEFDMPDEAGAFPIHALLVCNTPESLELAMELCQLVPEM
eukprot:6462896-Prymnesium_polylepis.1